MPIVDIAQPDITSPIDTPKGFVMTPGAKDIDHGSDAPQFSSVLGAAFRDGNLVGSYISAEDRNSPIYQEPGFKAWDAIKGTKYESKWTDFVDVRNTQAADEKKRQIDLQDESRRTLEAAPWYQSVPAQIAAGVIDLPTLIPGGAFMRGAAGGISIARTAAVTAGAAGVAATAQEAGLQKIQASRPLSESAVNIGASVLLGGLLGASGAKALSGLEWRIAQSELDRSASGMTFVPFSQWHSGSRAVDPTGQPMPLYHGTSVNLAKGNFTEFDKAKRGSATDAPSAKEAFFFSEDANVARSYADSYSAYDEFAPLRVANKLTGGLYEKANESLAGVFGRSAKREGRVATAYVDAKNPLIIDYAGKEYREETFYDAIKRAKAAGHDSVLFKNAVDQGFDEKLGDKPANIWAVFEPEQIRIAGFSNAKAEDINFPPPGTVPVGNTGALTSAGASAVQPGGLRGNSIAGKMASGVAAATARLNPALRILQSDSPATRDIGTKLFENSVYLKKNLDGIASEPAAETLMKEWNGGLAKAIKSTDESYAGYVKGGGEMSRSDFREAVGKAMRRDDASDIPEVDKVAKAWRSQVFDPLKNKAIEAKLLPPDVSVETAASYFTRMWNRNKLIAREGEFKQITARWVDSQYPRWVEDFDRETIHGASKLKDEKLRDYQTERRIEREARFGDPKEHGIDVANEVFNTLTGKVERGVRPEFMTINSRGPMKERTFNIPDHLVEDFLEHDVDLVGRRYTRVMGADVELAGKFGTPDMKDAIQKVRDDYAKLRTGLDNEKQLVKLGEAEKADIRDLEALRDLLRGTRQESPIERNYGRIVRGLNHVNYIRSMGEVVLASITDAVRPAMVHGLGQYLQTIPQLATNLKGIKLSVAEAKLAGNVAEGVLGHRLATISEIIDPYASRGPVETFLENMTNVGSKWNGIRIWTDAMKSVASVMTQDRIIKGVSGFGKIKAKEKSYLAFLGIDESMAGRIAKMFETHGETVNGVKVANTEEWTDAVAVRTYRAAMNKDVDSIIVQKSVADVPLFASTPTGRALLQFKSFALASHQKVLLRGLQEDQTRFVGGTIAMTAMGMLITYLKALSGNRHETAEKATSNPGWWIGEGLDRSGILSVPMEIANTFEKASGFNPVKSPLRALDDEGSISQKNQNRSLIGSIAGPSAGLIDDAATAASIPNTLYKGDDITKGQKGAAERLLPFNSYSGIRQMLRYVINPQD